MDSPTRSKNWVLILVALGALAFVVWGITRAASWITQATSQRILEQKTGVQVSQNGTSAGTNNDNANPVEIIADQEGNDEDGNSIDSQFQASGEAQEPVTLPKTFPKDFPVMADMMVTSSASADGAEGKGGVFVRWSTDKSPSDVMEFYAEALKGAKWEILFSTNENNTVQILFGRGTTSSGDPKEAGTLVANPSQSTGQTEVGLMYTKNE